MLIGSQEVIYDIFRRARCLSEPVVFPTDTIYGIGAPLADSEANRKIYDIKGREKNKPFPVLISSMKQAKSLADTAMHADLIKKLWPGAYTLILKAKDNVENLYTLNGNIALRMPADKRLTDLIEKTGPLSATSANLSGQEYTSDFIRILTCFQSSVKFYVHSRTNALNSSVIIDLTSDEPVILRGEINLHEILTDK